MANLEKKVNLRYMLNPFAMGKRILIIALLSLYVVHGFTQSTSDSKFIKKLAYNNLKINTEKTYKFRYNRFKPIKASVTAYTYDGKPVKLANTDIFIVREVYTGKWLKHTGDWFVVFRYVSNRYISLEYYIPSKYMKHVEVELVERERIEQEKKKSYRAQPNTSTSSRTFSFDDVNWIPIIIVSIFLLICWFCYLISGGSGSNGIESSYSAPKYEWFMGNDGLTMGTKTPLGDYRECSTGKVFTNQGDGTYRYEPWYPK